MVIVSRCITLIKTSGAMKSAGMCVESCVNSDWNAKYSSQNYPLILLVVRVAQVDDNNWVRGLKHTAARLLHTLFPLVRHSQSAALCEKKKHHLEEEIQTL